MAIGGTFGGSWGRSDWPKNCNMINATLGYSKRLAYVKWRQSESSKAHRVEGSSLMKARYPKKEDWRHIRFSNGVYFVLAMGLNISYE